MESAFNNFIKCLLIFECFESPILSLNHFYLSSISTLCLQRHAKIDTMTDICNII